MRTLVCLSTLVHHRVDEFTSDDGVSASLTTVQEAYLATKESLPALRNAVAAAEPAVTGTTTISTLTSFLPNTGHAFHQRNLGIALFMLIVQNCVLQRYAFDTNDLQQEAHELSTEVIHIARNAQCYRPLGASYALLCLMGAYVGITEVEARKEILELYVDYRRDFPGDKPMYEDEKEMRKIYSLLRFGPGAKEGSTEGSCGSFWDSGSE
jgi:hypothetical protein